MTSLAACGPDATMSMTTETSSALTASQTFLVSFTGGSIPANASAIVAAAGGTIVARYTNVGIVLVSTTASAFPTTLRADKRVASIGASKTVSSSIGVVKSSFAHHPLGNLHAPGSDPLSNRQWDMDQIHAPQARAINAGNKSVLVGVLDSGIDITHPDLVGQVNTAASASCIGGIVNTDPGVWANDIIGHGTHVSGNIAGAKNGVGIVGIAPGVKLAAVKLAVDDVNDPNFGLVFADAMVCAIDWSIGHNFDLMNASLTIDPFTAPIDDIFCSDEPDRQAIVTMVRQAVGAAARRNVTLVASTGNFFLDVSNLKGQTPGSTCKVLPVDLPRVIGVSSVGYTQMLSFFSDYGKGAVDLAGPGGDSLIPDPLVTDTTASGQVLSSVPPNSLYYQIAAGWNGQVQDCSSGTCSTYAYLQGTSQAAPHVTGVAALAISRFGRMPPEALLAFLSLTAKPLACPPSPYDPGATGMPATCIGSKFYNNFYGAGEVDALNVVR
ncbi:MAG TPA: S8 family serine peptidase [Polyangia bacterium]|nr:S8 family serine peptidase [Polyangia bacterium]